MTLIIFCRVVIAPLDVVKIRMQLQTHRTHFGFGHRNASMAPSPDIKYSKITQALKTILKEEGIRVKVTLFSNWLGYANTIHSVGIV